MPLVFFYSHCTFMLWYIRIYHFDYLFLAIKKQTRLFLCWDLRYHATKELKCQIDLTLILGFRDWTLALVRPCFGDSSSSCAHLSFTATILPLSFCSFVWFFHSFIFNALSRWSYVTPKHSTVLHGIHLPYSLHVFLSNVLYMYSFPMCFMYSFPMCFMYSFPMSCICIPVIWLSIVHRLLADFVINNECKW